MTDTNGSEEIGRGPSLDTGDQKPRALDEARRRLLRAGWVVPAIIAMGLSGEARADYTFPTLTITP